MVINCPRFIEQLKAPKITAIPHAMASQVIYDFRERLRQHVDNIGSHLTG